MAKGINQKLKLLYIAKILEEKTDEAHPMSTQQLIKELAAHEISAERKSIYDDIDQLIDFGYDININKSKRNGGYYIGSRHFELTELKLLVDSVQASRFITLKKSRELISKLEKMLSIHEENALKRNVYVQNRIKTDNESVYYVVNDIYNAMQTNKKIGFLYMEWDINKKKVPRHNGKQYVISPFALTIKDENYYLIAYDSEAEKIKHYRVDKIKNIAIIDEAREGGDKFDKFDVATYTNMSFGMFGGKEEVVTLEFDKAFVGVIMDRFGTEVDVRKIDDNKASARVKVAVSNQFYGWISSIGNDVKITAPAAIVQDYKDFLMKLFEQYK